MTDNAAQLLEMLELLTQSSVKSVMMTTDVYVGQLLSLRSSVMYVPRGRRSHYFSTSNSYSGLTFDAKQFFYLRP